MKKIVALLLLFSALIAMTLPLQTVMGYEAWGWDEIRDDLSDGDGAEFIVEIDAFGADEFSGATEMQAVIAAADWVAAHMVYESDPDPPGDVWESSDQLYQEIVADGYGTGDCEDFSILLCALLRFHTQGGIPAHRVWVQGGVIAVPPATPYGAPPPPIFGHAIVVYKAERGGIFYIEPQWGGIPYRGCLPSLINMPYFAGESAMLRFNDEWVKGGGFWLAPSTAFLVPDIIS